MKANRILLPTTALALRVLAPPKSVLAQEAARGWEERKTNPCADDGKQKGSFATMSRRVIAVTLGATTVLTLSSLLFFATRSLSSDRDISNAMGGPGSTIESASPLPSPTVAQEMISGREGGFTQRVAHPTKSPYADFSDAELAARVTALRDDANHTRRSFDALVAERKRALQERNNREAERLRFDLMKLARSREQLSAKLTESAFELTCRQLVGCNDDTRGRFYKHEK